MLEQRYQYLQLTFKDEHMLYLKEIADLYHIKTLTGNAHSKLITAIFNTYAGEQEEQIPEYYFLYCGALLRVYPKEFYDRAIKWFLNQAKNPGQNDSINLNGINYNFKITRKIQK